jgi:hypothetical protein
VGDCDPLRTECLGSAYLKQGMSVGDTVSGPDYLTIQDFRMTRNNSHIAGFSLYANVSSLDDNEKYIDHCIIRRNYVHETNGTMFYFYNGRYNIITGNKFVNYGQNGTDATQGVNFIRLNNSLVKGNEFGHDDSAYPSGCTSAEMVEIHGCHSTLIENNNVYGAANQSGIRPKEGAGGNSGLIIRYNKIHNNHSRTSGGTQRGKGIEVHTDASSPNSEIYIYGNYIFNNHSYGIALGDYVSDIKIWSNLIVSNGYHSIVAWGNYTGPTGISIFNNTIARSGTLDPANNGRAGIVLSRGEAFDIKNNIFWNNRPGGEDSKYWQIYSTRTIDSLEHNTYFHNLSPATVYYDGAARSISTLKSEYGFENDVPAGVVQSPSFTNPKGQDNLFGTADDNYTLQSGSASIDDGADLTQEYSINLSNGDSWFKAQTGYETITMSTGDALHPSTDWTANPPVVITAKQGASGANWERGAYVYASQSTDTTPPAAPGSVGVR